MEPNWVRHTAERIYVCTLHPKEFFIIFVMKYHMEIVHKMYLSDKNDYIVGFWGFWSNNFDTHVLFFNFSKPKMFVLLVERGVWPLDTVRCDFWRERRLGEDHKCGRVRATRWEYVHKVGRSCRRNDEELALDAPNRRDTLETRDSANASDLESHSPQQQKLIFCINYEKNDNLWMKNLTSKFSFTHRIEGICVEKIS